MNVVLSKRLETIASFIPKGAQFADIGSDHAYIPCTVCKKDPTARAIAGEVRSGPFQSAQKTVIENNLEERVDVRLGDGLDVIDVSTSHVVIAGMGGSLIRDILERGKTRLSNVEELIIQPNIGSDHVRRWMDQHAFEIIHEQIIEENDHMYEIVVAKQASEQGETKRLSEKELYFGPKLMRMKDPLFIKKWAREKRHHERIIEQIKRGKHPDKKQLDQFTKQINWIIEEVDNG